ncbi:hypothetical protein, partial [Enterococcus xiangfangensis]
SRTLVALLDYFFALFPVFFSISLKFEKIKEVLKININHEGISFPQTPLSLSYRNKGRYRL